MAKKKKTGGRRADAKKAVAAIEKAHKDLELQIKNLKKSLDKDDDNGGMPFFGVFNGGDGDNDKDDKKKDKKKGPK